MYVRRSYVQRVNPHPSRQAHMLILLPVLILQKLLFLLHLLLHHRMKLLLLLRRRLLLLWLNGCPVLLFQMMWLRPHLWRLNLLLTLLLLGYICGKLCSIWNM